MRDSTNLGVLLEMLEGDSEGPTLRSPEGGVSAHADARQREIVEHVRESQDAQLTLFLLAHEMKADATDSTEELVTELRAFAESVRDRFDVDLLQTAADNRDRLPEQVPDDLFADLGTA